VPAQITKVETAINTSCPQRSDQGLAR